VSEPELHDAVALRQRLDAWRRRDANLATIATAGTSPAARRARRRLQVAASIRCDVGFFGPPGCGSEAVAARIHQLSAPGEPLVRVDGPLMDAELLDAVLMPVVHQLGESSDSRATALVRGLDEMPLEAQQRLLALLRMTPGRLRLLALSRLQPAVLAEPVATPGEEDGLAEYSGGAAGIATELIEILSAMTVTTQPLCSRVEDIPLLATALLDARRAAGQGTVERLSRAALDALVIYPWPRNLDELEEAIGHAMRTAPGPLISAEHLPLAIRSFRPGESPANSRRAIVPLDAAVERYEARLIREAIEASGGNRAEAARKLGISRARLLRKMEVELDNDSQATKRSAP
jgi:DNA-binding NtrC family response regulator